LRYEEKILVTCFCNAGVALIATAVFRDSWLWGTCSASTASTGAQNGMENNAMSYYIVLFFVVTAVVIGVNRGWLK